MGTKFILVFLLTISISWSGQNPLDEESLSRTSAEERDKLTNAINEFGYTLMVKLMKKNVEHNVVISPTGIAGLLAMTLLGTVGGAYDELADVLGFSRDILMNRNNHEQFGELLQQLNSNETSSRTLYTDAIIVDAQTQIRSVYRDYLQRVYHGETLNTDFRNSSKSIELINGWVKEHTAGKIDAFLKKPLPVETQVVLLSALYFSGQWAQPFKKEFTQQMTFNKPSGNVTADLMLNAGHFRYMRDNEFHIIAFPYKDNVTTMYALMPISKRMQEDKSLTDVMENLNYSKINEAIDKMAVANCIIRFPKMDLKSENKLEDSLKELGVQSIFSDSDANFALMIDNNNNRASDTQEEELIARINTRMGGSSDLQEQLSRLPNPGVHVDSVLHNVMIKVDEFGTEAVAVTSGVLARTAKLFYANSPFYMFIRNERTKLVTFSAVIFDPTMN